MTDELVLKRILSSMGDTRYRVRAISISRLSEVEHELQGLVAEGLFDDEFYHERLTSFTFHPPDHLNNARSILVIAMPQPAVVLKFEWNGKDRSVQIPPTYDSRADVETEHRLRQILEPEGYTIARTVLPLKLLAARSGLMKYGKNNICYVPGMGSFFRLTAFYTDLPCKEERWGEAELLPRCNTCEACINTCPTHAISPDRYLLRAEHCLTFHNEHSKDFPGDIDPSWHHCLLGCMICQRYCPENKPFLGWSEERGRFSKDETGLILRETPLEKIPASTRRTLERLSLIDDYPVLARNLRAVLR